MKSCKIPARTGTASHARADEKEKFVGTWKLVSALSEDLETGQKTRVYKGTPVGFITYGADGRMMTIAVDSRRKKPAGTVATASEAEALFRSMAAYAGTYAIKGEQVIHHPDVSWNETWTGMDQIRHYKIDGDHLILATSASELLQLLTKVAGDEQGRVRELAFVVGKRSMQA